MSKTTEVERLHDTIVDIIDSVELSYFDIMGVLEVIKAELLREIFSGIEKDED